MKSFVEFVTSMLLRTNVNLILILFPCTVSAKQIWQVHVFGECHV